MEKERQLNFDLLRIFAIFCVVILHVSSSGFIKTEDSFLWNISNIYDSAVRFCVPVFVMLSGVFFLNPEKKYTLKKLFSHNILRIVTALIFWSAAYSATILYTQGALGIKTFLYYVILEPNHLWFLYMLLGLYIIVPFLRKIAENKRLAEYFIILSFVFASAVPFVQACLGATLSTHISEFVRGFSFYFALGFPGYFVLGFYLSKYPVKKSVKLVINILAVISLIFTILMTRSIYISSGGASEKYYSYLHPTTALVATSVFLFFKDTVSKIKFSDKQAKFIMLLSKCSFGIYLVHEGLRVALDNYFGFTVSIFNPVFSIPVIAITVFTISFCVTYVITKIPILNKYII